MDGPERAGGQGRHLPYLSDGEGFSSFHDADTAAEVDAAFRSQRRIAVAYGILFLVVVGGVALGTVTLSWASSDRILGGFSPSFLMTAVGLYLFFVALGVSAATLANGVDDTMLGAESLPAPRRRRAGAVAGGGDTPTEATEP